MIALTGQRYLDGYSSDEAQFKALMDQGITFGKQYALKSGVALTPEQMALLTGDIVWLVNTTVKMPDGSLQTVLVPQVYAKVKPGDIDGSGALLAGNHVNIRLDGDLFNSGTLNGRRVLQLDAGKITRYLRGQFTMKVPQRPKPALEGHTQHYMVVVPRFFTKTAK
ncbi:hypothetical protein P2G42_11645 [Klebsiella electrica]|nr:hypothetical protein [Klebsiella electrica]WIO45221.1 hypothetical protein P2G42_11645 [Klebsiella electrica]